MLRNIKLMHFKCFEQLELNCKQLNLLCGFERDGQEQRYPSVAYAPAIVRNWRITRRQTGFER